MTEIKGNAFLRRNLAYKLLFALSLVAFYLIASAAFAQQINLSSGQRPSCNTSWQVSGNMYTCSGGNGSITILSGRQVVANTNSQLYSRAQITVQNNTTIGSSNASISLESDYGQIQITGSSMFGNITSNSNITLTNTTVVGNVNASGSVTLNNSTVIGTVSANQTVSVTNGSSIEGPVTSSGGAVNLDNSSIDGNVTANSASTIGNNSHINGTVLITNGTLTVNNGTSINGDIRSNCCNVNVSSSSIYGNVESGNSNITITDSVFAGAAVITNSNNTITITNSEMLSGELSAWVINIDNQSNIGTQSPVLVNAQNQLNNGSQLNAICTPDYSRCSASISDIQSTIPMCTDVWRGAQRNNNQFYPETGITLPEDALSTAQLPQNMQPIDYLRRGDFGAVGQNWQPSGNTARVYIDGDQVIQRGVRLNQNGSPERLIIVVTGNLTIEPDVIINGYIYVQGNVTYAPLNTTRDCTFIVFCGDWYASEQAAQINGSITSDGTTLRPDGGVGNAQRRAASVHNANIQYTAPNRNIQGGQFCLGQPRQELWLQFSDDSWSTAFGSVADSSPQSSSVVNTGAGFSFPSGPLSARAPNAPTFGPAGVESALVADDSTNFEGTCSFADFSRDDEELFEIPDNFRLDFKGSFTIGTWVYPVSYPDSDLMTIFSKDENYEFHLRPDGTTLWWWNNRAGQTVSFNSSFTIPLNEWSYVGIRYTPTQQTIFRVTGASVQTTTLNDTTGLATNGKALLIGQDHGSFNRFFDGRLDEFRVFRGNLTNAELISLAQERASVCDNLLELICTSDDFQDSSGFNLLWQTASSSGDFTPQIVGGRLRLNQAVGDQATVASLRRAFPAADNYIEVAFDFNAYAGNSYNGSIGGDGIAIVFSDADVVPIPGSYGGSLGYAQRDSSGGGIPGNGFQGGWLGIGLDIYGNFSLEAEGREGGLGLPISQTRRRISLRGAEETDYEFITASNQLTDMSSGSTTPPDPDRYKVIIDSRASGTSFITVLRKRPADTDFIEVIPPFDIYDILPSQQPAVPERFRLSFTGSTGGAFGIHELDNLEVCALESQALGPVLDHVRLGHSGELVSCFSETIELIGCLNDDCSQQYTGSGEVVLQASSGSWSNALSSNGQNASIPLTNGTGEANLNFAAGGTTSFTLLGSEPVPVSSSPLRCYTGNILDPNPSAAVACDVLFKTAGLAFVEPGNINQLDQRPVVSGANSTRALRTVETNSLTGACEARVENESLPTSLGFTCINPSNCVSGQTLDIDGQTISDVALTSVPLSFDADGVALLNNFNYSDVGEIRLNANLIIPEDPVSNAPAVTLTGQSAPFVSTPDTLAIYALNDNGTIRYSIGPFKASGEAFNVLVQAQNALGAITPNFGNESTPVVVNADFIETYFPNNGFPGQLSSGNGFVLSPTVAGRFINENLAWSEAGTFLMRASIQDDLYLGINTSSTLNRPPSAIGRFFPSHFNLISSSITNSCTLGGFTYMDEPNILVDFELNAVNTGNVITRNYGFNDYVANALATAVATSGSDSLTDEFANRLTLSTDSWDEGVLTFSSTEVAFLRHPNDEPDGPYPNVDFGLHISNAEDNRGFLVADSTLSTLAGNAVPLSGQLSLRYGRLVLENIAAPEDEDLNVVMRAEYWNNDRFMINNLDNCTPTQVASLNLLDNPSGLTLLPDGSSSFLDDGELTFGDLLWQAANQQGEFEFEYEAPPWLQYPWIACEINPSTGECDEASHENPRAFGSFGQYRGNDRIIYWLELR